MLYSAAATMLDAYASTLDFMGTYGDRLAEALKRPGKTRAGLAKAMGRSVQAVSQLVLGKSKQATAENNASAAAYLECDPNWLATGRGAPAWGYRATINVLSLAEPASSYGPPPSMTDTIRRLGDLLAYTDELARAAIGPLLQALAQRPNEADAIAGMIEGLAASSRKQTGT